VIVFVFKLDRVMLLRAAVKRSCHRTVVDELRCCMFARAFPDPFVHGSTLKLSCLQVNTTLVDLDIDGNLIDFEGEAALLAALQVR
jgi:hypothetical protein